MDKVKYIKNFNRLTENDRKNISKYYKEGLNYTQIGLKVGKDRRTISREIKRNGSSNITSHRFKNVKSYRYSSGKAHK